MSKNHFLPPKSDAIGFRSPSPVMSVNADAISSTMASSPSTGRNPKTPKPNLKLNLKSANQPRTFASIANQVASSSGPFSPSLFGKRVWVRRPHGTATTITVTQNDIIDDLKTAIIGKFPNALAKHFDPADITLKMDPAARNYSHKKPYNSSVSPESSKPTISPVVGAAAFKDSFNYVNLEPDQNVWTLLELYYPQGMTMSEALLIDTPEVEQYAANPSYSYHSVSSPTLQQPQRSTTPNSANSSGFYHPKPQYSTYHNALSYDGHPKDRSISPSASKSSPLNAGVSHHRRSQSNPPQSPVSTSAKANNAVLLLPKNFSSSNGGQIQPSAKPTPAPKKRLSLDENLVNKSRDAASLPSIKDSDKSPSPFPTIADTSQDSAATLKADDDARDSVTPEPPKASKPDRKDSEPKEKRVVSGDHDKKPSRSSSGSKRKDEGYRSKTATETVLPSISVLVVEDNAINQAILGAFLRKHKIHYEIAKNGQEAMDKWRKGGFHLVLMDIQLPVKSGIEATKEIRYLERINRIGVFAENEIAGTNPADLPEEDKLDMNVFRSPVIIVALTASSNASVDRSNALRAGCNDYLTKPVNLVWLQNKITEWGCMQALIDFNGWKTKRSNFNGSTRMLSTGNRTRSGSQVHRAKDAPTKDP